MEINIGSNIESFVALASLLLGGGGIWKLATLKAERKSKDLENDSKQLENDSNVVDRTEKLLKLMEEQLHTQVAFYESEVASVRKSNEEKKVQIAEDKQLIGELRVEISRLTAENAEKDKIIAVKEARECIRRECDNRLHEGDADATFQALR